MDIDAASISIRSLDDQAKDRILRLEAIRGTKLRRADIRDAAWSAFTLAISHAVDAG